MRRWSVSAWALVGAALLGLMPSGASAQTSPPVPLVSFEHAVSYWSENAGAAAVTVRLSTPSDQVVTVNYTTGDGAPPSGATAPADYLQRAGTVTFSPGEPLAQTIAVTLVNDGASEPLQSFQLNLSNPVNAQLGSPSTHTLYVLDDDSSGGQPPVANPDEFYIPPGSTSEIPVDVLANDYDPDGGEIVIISVTPLTEGTVRWTPTMVYYTPPPSGDKEWGDALAASDPAPGPDKPANQPRAKFEYKIADPTSDTATSQAENKPDDVLSKKRNYSRGNDDKDQSIYETTKIDVTIECKHSTKTVKVIYKATMQTDDANARAIAQQIYLQPEAKPKGGRVREEDPGVVLKLTGTGVGATLTAELEVKKYDGAGEYSGNAVLQRRMDLGGGVFTYDHVHETIEWHVKVEGEGKNEAFKEFLFDMKEHPLPNFPGELLRKGDHDFRPGKRHKLLFPAKADGLERDPAKPERPKTPPAGWDDMITIK